MKSKIMSCRNIDLSVRYLLNCYLRNSDMTPTIIENEMFDDFIFRIKDSEFSIRYDKYNNTYDFVSTEDVYNLVNKLKLTDLKTG